MGDGDGTGGEEEEVEEKERNVTEEIPHLLQTYYIIQFRART